MAGVWVGLLLAALGCGGQRAPGGREVPQSQQVSSSFSQRQTEEAVTVASAPRAGQAAPLQDLQPWAPRGKLSAVVFAPHPDDETLAAGGLIQAVLQAGGRLRVVFLTDGDGYADGVRAWRGRESLDAADFVAYGAARRHEALAALARLGLPAKDVVFLGFPDDGLHELWVSRWERRRPWRSPHTGWSHPPGRGPLVAGLNYSGKDLATAIGRILRKWRPQLVVMPDPRDRHSDHCSTGLFVLEALRRVSVGRSYRPELLGYLVHAPDYPGAASWLAAARASGVCGSEAAREVLGQTPWVEMPVSATALDRKRDAISEYRSQQQVMREFLFQFARPVEWFARFEHPQVETVPALYGRQASREVVP